MVVSTAELSKGKVYVCDMEIWGVSFGSQEPEE
jgi:hypothetical protein